MGDSKKKKNTKNKSKQKSQKVMPAINYPRIILGLDVSTACVGVSIVADDGVSEHPQILKLTHVAPKLSGSIKGIERLLKSKDIFEKEFLENIRNYEITDVVIEEPLMTSNNAVTAATLIRFNGMIAEAVYRVLGIVPVFISSYDARTFSFPELVSLRKYDKIGKIYPENHVLSDIKNGHVVLFGSYPFDIDKKKVMMDMVNSIYPQINWVKNEKGEILKENYDACDSLVCALAFINVNHHGVAKVGIIDSEKTSENGKTLIKYKTKIWDKVFEKELRL